MRMDLGPSPPSPSPSPLSLLQQMEAEDVVSLTAILTWQKTCLSSIKDDIEDRSSSPPDEDDDASSRSDLLPSAMRSTFSALISAEIQGVLAASSDEIRPDAVEQSAFMAELQKLCQLSSLPPPPPSPPPSSPLHRPSEEKRKQEVLASREEVSEEPCVERIHDSHCPCCRGLGDPPSSSSSRRPSSARTRRRQQQRGSTRRLRKTKTLASSRGGDVSNAVDGDGGDAADEDEEEEMVRLALERQISQTKTMLSVEREEREREWTEMAALEERLRLSRREMDKMMEEGQRLKEEVQELEASLRDSRLSQEELRSALRERDRTVDGLRREIGDKTSLLESAERKLDELHLGRGGETGGGPKTDDDENDVARRNFACHQSDGEGHCAVISPKDKSTCTADLIANLEAEKFAQRGREDPWIQFLQRLRAMNANAALILSRGEAGAERHQNSFIDCEDEDELRRFISGEAGLSFGPGGIQDIELDLEQEGEEEEDFEFGDIMGGKQQGGRKQLQKQTSAPTARERREAERRRDFGRQQQQQQQQHPATAILGAEKQEVEQEQRADLVSKLEAEEEAFRELEKLESCLLSAANPTQPQNVLSRSPDKRSSPRFMSSTAASASRPAMGKASPVLHRKSLQKELEEQEAKEASKISVGPPPRPAVRKTSFKSDTSLPRRLATPPGPPGVKGAGLSLPPAHPGPPSPTSARKQESKGISHAPKRPSPSLQDKRSRMMFLEQERAAMDREIRALRSELTSKNGQAVRNGNGVAPVDAFAAALDEDASIAKAVQEEMRAAGVAGAKESGNPLEDLCQLIVSRVLQRVLSQEQQKSQASEGVNKNGLSPSKPGAERAVVKKCWSEDYSGAPAPSSATPEESRRQQMLLEELESALALERTKSLEWMERHNRERDARHLAQAENEEVSRRLEMTASRADADRDELGQLQRLYQEERAQAEMLEEALRCEREALHKLTATLELERGRSKAASDRDADTIIELRTALEVERENSAAAVQEAVIRATTAEQQRQQQQVQQTPVSGSMLEGFGAVQPEESDAQNISPQEQQQLPPLPMVPPPPMGVPPGVLPPLIPHPLSHSPSQLLRPPQLPQSAEEAEQLAMLVRQLQHELMEERGRVDALKQCLEIEREKSSTAKGAPGADNPAAATAVAGAAAPPPPPGGDDPFMQHEWIVFNERRFEALEMQRAQMAKDLLRQRAVGERVAEELHKAREQLRKMAAKDNPKSEGGGGTFEEFYVRDLESKLEAHRGREVSLQEELERARMLLQSLQKENAILLDREREMMIVQEQLHERAFPRLLEEISAGGPMGPPAPPPGANGSEAGPPQQVIPGASPGTSPEFAKMSAEMQEHKMTRVLGINEALQDKVKILENKISRLEDDLELEIETNAAKGDFSQQQAVRNRLLLTEQHRQSLIWQKQYLLLLLQSHAASSKSHKSRAPMTQPYFAVFPRLTGRRSPIRRFRVAAVAVLAAVRLSRAVPLTASIATGLRDDDEDMGEEEEEETSSQINPILTTDL